MFKEQKLPAKVDAESMVKSLMEIEGLGSIIPPEHLEFFKSVIYRKILEHIPRILSQENWGAELGRKNLCHVHIYFKGEYGDIRDIKKMKEKAGDITYLYHSKELMSDSTNRNIFVDDHGRFEAYDDTDDDTDGGLMCLACEGKEIVQIGFSGTLEGMREIIEIGKGHLDKNSIAKVGELFFVASNINYR